MKWVNVNILFLSQIVPYPPHGGVLQRSYNILRESGKYNNVHLLAFVHPEYLGTPEQLQEAKEHLERFCKKVEFFTLWPKQSKLHKLVAFAAGLFYPHPFSALAHKSASMEARIQAILHEYPIDIMHFDTIGLVRYFRRALKIPAVLTHHNIESMLMARRAKFETNWLAQYYVSLQAEKLRAYEIFQSPKFALNVVVSKTDELELKQLAPGIKTVVVPNGVDTEYYNVRDEPQAHAVIYTGGMNMFANHDAVMHLIKDIWPAVKAKVSEAIFHVVGQNPPPELYEVSKQDPSILVHGFVDDIRPYVAKSAIYVVPLRVGGGTRLKVLDALALGKAIVSTSVGCEGIEVTDGVNIHIEDDDNRFADRVVELLQNPDQRKRLGANARLLAEEKYGWIAIGQVLQGAYEKVAGKR